MLPASFAGLISDVMHDPFEYALYLGSYQFSHHTRKNFITTTIRSKQKKLAFL